MLVYIAQQSFSTGKRGTVSIVRRFREVIVTAMQALTTIEVRNVFGITLRPHHIYQVTTCESAGDIYIIPTSRLSRHLDDLGPSISSFCAGLSRKCVLLVVENHFKFICIVSFNHPESPNDSTQISQLECQAYKQETIPRVHGPCVSNNSTRFPVQGGWLLGDKCSSKSTILRGPSSRRGKRVKMSWATLGCDRRVALSASVGDMCGELPRSEADRECGS